MIKAHIVLFFLLIGLSCRNIEAQKELVIAFGSCNHQWEEQPIWDKIDAQHPDIWIWLGDIIYADTESMIKMKSDYDLQTSNDEYQDFITDKIVYGTWDDHDYGANNSGKDYAQKDSSKMLLLDFLDVPSDNLVHTRPGVYQSYQQSLGEHLIKIILLDVRYFRDDPGSENTIIGDEQWAWFENELQNSKADIHIIGGGSQFLPEDHRFEKWANYPSDRKRLLDLLDKYEVNLPLLISGDRHLAEMSLVPTDGGIPVLEVTSSGLTHSYRGFTQETNRHRVGGDVVSSKNFGVIKLSSSTNVQYEVGLYNEEGQLEYSLNSGQLRAKLERKN